MSRLKLSSDHALPIVASIAETLGSVMHLLDTRRIIGRWHLLCSQVGTGQSEPFADSPRSHRSRRDPV